MANIRFEWDEAKNLANQRKHNISFEDASEVFLDPLSITKQDRDRDEESRWQTFGVVKGLELIMVAHTIWEEGDDGVTTEVIRIISARLATQKERREHEDENG